MGAMLRCWLFVGCFPLLVKIDAATFEVIWHSFSRYCKKAVSTTIDGTTIKTNFTSKYLFGRKISDILSKVKHNR